MDYLVVGSLGIGLFLGCLIVGKSARAVADWLLAGWFGLLSVHLAAVWVVAGQQEARWWMVLHISQALTLLTGTVLWLYARALTRSRFRLADYRWHLLPAALALLTVGWASLDATGQRAQWLLPLTAAGGLVSVLAYAAATIRLARHTGASASGGPLRWVRLAAGSLLGLVVVFGGSQLVLASGLAAVAQYGNWYANALLCGVVVMLSYGSVRRSDGLRTGVPCEVAEDARVAGRQTSETAAEFSRQPENEPEAPPVAACLQSDQLALSAGNEVAGKYRRSGLTAAELDAVWRQLRQHMATERAYLLPDLTLPHLSQQLGVPAHHVSRVINERGGQHFYDFVNGYRVAAVREQLHAGAHHRLTLLGVALACGFNSKASFNRAFRKATGLTPSQYLAQPEPGPGAEQHPGPISAEAAAEVRRSR